MCGIAGLFQSRNSLPPAYMNQVVESMLSTMPHRGPDAQGVWSDPSGRCVLGHLRLSIIDTSDAGRQPMASGDGRRLISFNGELYNFQELRPALAAAGVALRGRTDTEVLIESLALWGTDALSKFDGMFAFAVFDTLSGELLLARDPFGEKPLYYMQLKNGGFAFASELQALERVPGFDGTVSVDAMAELLTFQYIGAPRSIYQNVKKLPPAHWLRVSADGQITTGRYFEFRPGTAASFDRSIGDLADELEDLLAKSLKRRLISDVPLGAFLSGGVDSSTVCGLVRRKLDRPLKSFSIGFEGAPETEHLIARSFAQHLGTDHHEQILAPNASDFLFGMGALLDEPNADSSCLPTYLLSRFAREQVTVAISGDGGDEMFGGYGRYFHTLEERDRHRAGELPGWRPGEAYFGSRILVAAEPQLTELFGFVPRGFADHLAHLRNELNEADEALLLPAMRRSDVENYMPGAVLPKVDRMSMRHSLEVRTPFLSVEVARFAERLPESVLVRQGRGKLVLREVAYRHLPRDLVDLPKQGFGMPMSDWGRANLLDIVAQLLEGDDSRLRAAIGEEGVNRFLTRQRTPGNFAAYQVWAVAALESWLRHHPATVPQLTEARRGRQQEQQESHQLHAVPLGRAFYAVTRQRADRPIEETAQAPLRSVPLEVTFRIFDLPERQGSAAQPESLKPMRLPDWGIDPLPHEAQRLRGATLFFADADAALHLDHLELRKFMKLGARSVIFHGIYIGGELTEIRLKEMSRLDRVRAFLRLFPRRAATIGNKLWMRLFLRSKRFSRDTDGRHVSELIRAIDPVPERDLSPTFLAFEGMRQLPPVHVSHADIAAKGNGRYSVFEQIFFFSPTGPGREKKPYWLLRKTAETVPLLEMVPYRYLEDGLLGKAAASPFGDLLEHADAAPITLQPGDTVAVCTHGLPPGGAERQWVYLAQGLKDAGYKVVFLTLDAVKGENAHYLPMVRDSALDLVEVSDATLADQIRLAMKYPSIFEKLRSSAVPGRTKIVNMICALDAIKPKVIFAQLDETNVLTGYAAHLADVPRIVLSFRNYNPSKLPYLYKDWYLPAYQTLCKSSRIVLTGNHRGANDDYAEWIGVAPERVVHVANAIEPQTFAIPDDAQIERARAELGISARTPVIVGAFRLAPEKSPSTFVEVCARVSARIPEARMFIAGVGSLRGDVEQLIAELGLKSHVKLLGRRSDVNVLMRLANVFLLTSNIEGMPNVLLEAQLVGTPVVSTRAGGSPDVVVDGETGILCNIGDVEALSTACIDLLRVPARARRMGTAARNHVLSTFSKERMVQGYLDAVRAKEPKEKDSASARQKALTLAS